MISPLRQFPLMGKIVKFACAALTAVLALEVCAFSNVRAEDTVPPDAPPHNRRINNNRCTNNNHNTSAGPQTRRHHQDFQDSNQ